MTEAVSIVVALALFAIVAVLADIAVSLRAIRRRAEQGVPSFSTWTDCNPFRHFLPIHWPFAGTSFAIWVFDKGAWKILRKCGQPRCECKSPSQRGEYEGQVIRNECPKH